MLFVSCGRRSHVTRNLAGSTRGVPSGPSMSYVGSVTGENVRAAGSDRTALQAGAVTSDGRSAPDMRSVYRRDKRVTGEQCGIHGSGRPAPAVHKLKDLVRIYAVARRPDEPHRNGLVSTRLNHGTRRRYRDESHVRGWESVCSEYWERPLRGDPCFRTFRRG